MGYFELSWMMVTMLAPEEVERQQHSHLSRCTSLARPPLLECSFQFELSEKADEDSIHSDTVVIAAIHWHSHLWRSYEQDNNSFNLFAR